LKCRQVVFLVTGQKAFLLSSVMVGPFGEKSYTGEFSLYQFSLVNVDDGNDGGEDDDNVDDVL
jgi:hypothetical protein